MSGLKKLNHRLHLRLITATSIVCLKRRNHLFIVVPFLSSFSQRVAHTLLMPSLKERGKLITRCIRLHQMKRVKVNGSSIGNIQTQPQFKLTVCHKCLHLINFSLPRRNSTALIIHIQVHRSSSERWGYLSCQFIPSSRQTTHSLKRLTCQSTTCLPQLPVVLVSCDYPSGFLCCGYF